MDSATKTIASFFALSAFAIAIVAGTITGNSPRAVLSTALISMVLCRVLGWFVALAAVRVVRAELAAFRASNPVPDLTSALAGAPDPQPAIADVPELSTKSSQST